MRHQDVREVCMYHLYNSVLRRSHPGIVLLVDILLSGPHGKTGLCMS